MITASSVCLLTMHSNRTETGGGSVLWNTNSLFKGPKFRSQHPHGSSRLSVDLI